MSALDEVSLAELATQHGTDKWNSHWYAQHYDRHFARMRRLPVRLLEVGVGGYHDPAAGGESLRMWRDYFPQGKIVGIDLFDKSPHAEERIAIYRGSQVDEAFLQRVVNAEGPFDIIIDDGSHRSDHVVRTFKWLFVNALRPEGIYAAEDLQTSYWQAYGGSPSTSSRKSSMGYFKSLCDGLNWMEMHRPGKAPDAFQREIVGVHFYHGLAFVEKGANDKASTMVTDRNVPLGLRHPLLARARGVVRRLVRRA